MAGQTLRAPFQHHRPGGPEEGCVCSAMFGPWERDPIRDSLMACPTVLPPHLGILNSFLYS